MNRKYTSEKMRVSPETIYQWLYLDARQGGVHYKSLVQHHKKRFLLASSPLCIYCPDGY